jgi:hypothetical protein
MRTLTTMIAPRITSAVCPSRSRSHDDPHRLRPGRHSHRLS